MNESSLRRQGERKIVVAVLDEHWPPLLDDAVNVQRYVP